MYPYPKSIEEAAEVLDKARPGWEKELTTKEILMKDEYRCVLGTLYGKYLKGLAVLFGSELSREQWEDNIYGTRAPLSEWQAEIEKRINSQPNYEEMLWQTCDYLSNKVHLYLLPENVRTWYDKVRDARKAALAAEIAAAKAKLTARELEILGVKQ